MGNISEYKPGNDIVLSWEAAVGLPWDPFDSCAVNNQRELVCPKCDIIVVARSSTHIPDLVASFSMFLAHSLPRARKDGSGTTGFHLRLQQVRIHHYEREPRSFQIRARSREGS